MTDSKRTVATVTIALGVAVAVVMTFAAGCGGGGDSDPFADPEPPVGKPMLPDIVPAPPTDVHIRHIQKGDKWRLAFSSIMVNIGRGDLILRAARDEGGEWHVNQVIRYSTSGGKVVPVNARLIWGGDGHNHWHIRHVAVNRLVPLDAQDQPAPDKKGWLDRKAGFCFYDYSRQLDSGPFEAVYERGDCGHSRDATDIGMGLSDGWADVYNYGLRGQSVDVTAVPDGNYRLWAKADVSDWFRDARSDNNVTWVDVKLATKASGARGVEIIGHGPLIRPNS